MLWRSLAAERGDLLCLEHALPFASAEEIWFEEPRRRTEGLFITAHVMVLLMG